MATNKDSDKISLRPVDGSSAPGYAEAQPTSPGAVSPSSVPVDMLTKMLGVEETVIRGHVEEGLPTNADGTISLVIYAAWLISKQ